MRLRRAFPEDKAAVDRLLELAYPTLMALSYPREAFAAALPSLTTANAALLSSGTYYVVQDEVTERLLGCGGWTAERPGTTEIIPGVAHLRHFATDPAFARQGIGRVIFRECGPGAKRWGATRFQVYSSLNAVSFYTALGLAPVGQMELALAPGVSLAAIVMEGPIRTE